MIMMPSSFANEDGVTGPWVAPSIFPTVGQQIPAEGTLTKKGKVMDDKLFSKTPAFNKNESERAKKGYESLSSDFVNINGKNRYNPYRKNEESSSARGQEKVPSLETIQAFFHNHFASKTGDADYLQRREDVQMLIAHRLFDTSENGDEATQKAWNKVQKFLKWQKFENIRLDGLLSDFWQDINKKTNNVVESIRSCFSSFTSQASFYQMKLLEIREANGKSNEGFINAYSGKFENIAEKLRLFQRDLKYSGDPQLLNIEKSENLRSQVKKIEQDLDDIIKDVPEINEMYQVNKFQECLIRGKEQS